jgi:hypothetical protein
MIAFPRLSMNAALADSTASRWLEAVGLWSGDAFKATCTTFK